MMSTRGPKDGSSGAWVLDLCSGARGAHGPGVDDKDFHDFIVYLQQWLQWKTKVWRSSNTYHLSPRSVGFGDKVLAELGINYETVDEFDAKLKENGVGMPDYFVRTLWTIIHAILPPKPKLEKESKKESIVTPWRAWRIPQRQRQVL